MKELLVDPAEGAAPVPFPEAETSPLDVGVLWLSDIDPDLLRRIAGLEALAEGMLRRSNDAELPGFVYLLHDVMMRSRSDRQDIFFYFHQPKQQIDEAIGLFRAYRKSICSPDGLAPDEHPMLQLYLLYDCLVQAGCVARGVRQIAYLAEHPDYDKWRMRLPDFLDQAETGRLFNFVLVRGKPFIASSERYHSEIAGGRPAQTLGQILKIRHKDGSLSLLLSNETGHYRVPFDSIHEMVRVTGDYLKERYPEEDGQAPNRPRLILCPGSIQTAFDRMAC